MSKNTKEWTGRCALALLGLLLVGAGELGLRLVGFGSQYSFVLGDDKGGEGKSCLNSQYVALHYFKNLPVNLAPLMKDKPWFTDTEFSTERQPGAYRIFMVGASTTRGFPFTGREINYSRFLDLILQDVLPRQEVEVINAGYDALSSFGVLDITREVIKQSPNMLVIYTGHNEFIGQFGVNSNTHFGNQRWVMDLVTQMYHSRLFLAGELLAMKIHAEGKESANRESQVNMFRAMLSRSDITWDQEGHSQALHHYRENLNRMVGMATKKGIHVVLLNPASNLRDFEPIRSMADERLSSVEVTRMKEFVEQGKAALKSGKTALALAQLKTALQMDSGYAAGHFWLGRALEASGDTSGAGKEYRLAREMDRVHLRACNQMQTVVEDVGKRHEVTVVNLEKTMESVSPNGLIGENLFLEHVHPNINGHFVIANSLAHTLSEEKGSGLNSGWDWSRLKDAREYVRQVGYDARAFVNARYTVGRLLLDFPFYQCEAGEKILTRIKRRDAEQTGIEACYRYRKQDFDSPASS